MLREVVMVDPDDNATLLPVGVTVALCEEDAARLCSDGAAYELKRRGG